MESSPPGPSVHGTLQARVLELPLPRWAQRCYECLCVYVLEVRFPRKLTQRKVSNKISIRVIGYYLEIIFTTVLLLGFPGGSVLKNLSAIVEEARDAGLIPGSGRSLEEGMVIHSCILAWRILWTEEPGGYSPWGHKETDTIEVTEYGHVLLLCPQV